MLHMAFIPPLAVCISMILVDININRRDWQNAHWCHRHNSGFPLYISVCMFSAIFVCLLLFLMSSPIRQHPESVASEEPLINKIHFSSSACIWLCKSQYMLWSLICEFLLFPCSLSLPLSFLFYVWTTGFEFWYRLLVRTVFLYCFFSYEFDGEIWTNGHNITSRCTSLVLNTVCTTIWWWWWRWWWSRLFGESKYQHHRQLSFHKVMLQLHSSTKASVAVVVSFEQVFDTVFFSLCNSL